METVDRWKKAKKLGWTRLEMDIFIAGVMNQEYAADVQFCLDILSRAARDWEGQTTHQRDKSEKDITKAQVTLSSLMTEFRKTYVAPNKPAGAADKPEQKQTAPEGKQEFNPKDEAMIGEEPPLLHWAAAPGRHVGICCSTAPSLTPKPGSCACVACCMTVCKPGRY